MDSVSVREEEEEFTPSIINLATKSSSKVPLLMLPYPLREDKDYCFRRFLWLSESETESSTSTSISTWSSSSSSSSSPNLNLNNSSSFSPYSNNSSLSPSSSSPNPNNKIDIKSPSSSSPSPNNKINSRSSSSSSPYANNKIDIGSPSSSSSAPNPNNKMNIKYFDEAIPELQSCHCIGLANYSGWLLAIRNPPPEIVLEDPSLFHHSLFLFQPRYSTFSPPSSSEIHSRPLAQRSVYFSQTH